MSKANAQAKSPSPNRRRRVLLGVGIPVVLILALVILLAAVLVPASVGVSQGPMNHAYATVMANIEGIVAANPRWIDMAMLGSHDSFTSDLEHDRVEVCAKALKAVLPLARNFAYRYGLTQMVGIYDQLMQGTRFLHLKVTWYENTRYTSHSQLSGTLEKHLMDVLRFLEQPTSAGEIVGVLVQPIYMGDRTLAQLDAAIVAVRLNGRSLYDYVRYGSANCFNLEDAEDVRIGELRYNTLTAEGTQAGVVLLERREASNYLADWDADATAYPYFFDMDSNAIHTWHQRSDQTLLLQSVLQAQSVASDTAYRDMLRVNQTQASVSFRTPRDTWASLTATSLVHIASDYNVTLIEREDIVDILAAMPVLQVDFVTSTYGDFNNKANAVIRQYNQALAQRLQNA